MSQYTIEEVDLYLINN
jgi:hypothetical protein